MNVRKNPNIVVRVVKPAIFLVDITKCYNNKNEILLHIDDTGLLIWNCIKEKTSRTEIVDRFLSQLIDEKDDSFVGMVTNDVNDFLDQLLANNCILKD